MHIVLRAALAGLLLMSASSLAFAGRRAGGVPGCQQAVTNIPWGTIDTACVGGPPGPGGWNGGQGGPGMRITPEARRNWPDYPAPVIGELGPTQSQTPFAYGKKDGQGR